MTDHVELGDGRLVISDDLAMLDYRDVIFLATTALGLLDGLERELLPDDDDIAQGLEGVRRSRPGGEL